MQKLNIYLNNVYIASSINYKTCKELKNKILNDKKIVVASIPESKAYFINNNDVITVKKEVKR